MATQGEFPEPLPVLAELPRLRPSTRAKTVTWITKRFENVLKITHEHLVNGSFFQLWEESQKENSRLRNEMGKMKDDLGATKRKLDATLHVSFHYL